MYNDPVVKHGFARGTEPVTYVDQILSRWANYKEFVLAPDLNENQPMARGFESKGVESQQAEDRQQSRQGTASDREAAERRDRDQKRASLETSRRRVARELAATHSETHRAALKNALAFLDAELKKLD